MRHLYIIYKVKHPSNKYKLRHLSTEYKVRHLYIKYKVRHLSIELLGTVRTEKLDPGVQLFMLLQDSSLVESLNKM